MKKVRYNKNMEFDWKNIGINEINILNSWLTIKDKRFLCMTEKSWEQSARDIGDCLKNMDNAQFKNIMGYVNGKPAVALMFGIESIEVLNLYNIIVNPEYRNMGIAKAAVSQLLNNDKSLNLVKKYKKVRTSVLPENNVSLNFFEKLNYNDMGFDGEYVVFEKALTQTRQFIK